MDWQTNPYYKAKVQKLVAHSKLILLQKHCRVFCLATHRRVARLSPDFCQRFARTRYILLHKGHHNSGENIVFFFIVLF